MTFEQGLAFAVIGGAVALFATGRFRYDLVALGALLVGLAVGIVKPKEAFTGFTSDVVVIIATALVVSAAVQRSGVIEMALRPITARLKTATTQVPMMAGLTALLSMPTKNVGALAILMPVALQLAKKTETSVSSILMPMSFMSLLGGLVTLVGTSTNIIVSQVRQETVGKSFEMFDFAPVGLVLTGIGLLFVSLAWRVLPKDRKGQAGMADAVGGAAYSTEATGPEQWPENLQTVGDLKLEEDGVTLSSRMAGGEKGSVEDHAKLNPKDVFVLEGEQEALDRVMGRLPITPEREGHEAKREDPTEEMRSVEAVVQRGSVLIGSSAQRVRLKQKYGVNLLAVGRQGERITERLRDVDLLAGDVLVLQAGERSLPDAMKTLGVLPLAEGSVRLGGVRRRWSPIIILSIAMVLVAVKVVPVAVAFFGAAILIVASGGLSMRQAYESLEGQVLVLIGALTPLSEAVRHTGGTELIAGGLAHVMTGAPALLTLGALMITAMLCAPFLHNAPTVLVLGPIGVSLAQKLHLNPDPFLMAVATGAGCDFLTPIGHQCNTLVMGPGGYKFWDYARLGAPLSILVILLGTPLIAFFWPLVQHR